ncbi:lytic transglycosylase domain-containing protein [Nocardioides caeni]|uniref:lytic transglycosylase domain-containing protein n=1 Tax=Nocardioides caeni TaxID=574700 RepID=UPI00193115F1|nr:lytic murein transglycosylase [Nocardioides caeni]
MNFDRALGVTVVTLTVIALGIVGAAVALANGVIGGDGQRAGEVTIQSPAPPPPGVVDRADTGASTGASVGVVVDPYLPDPAWLGRTAAATGIPERALAAYARAHLQILDEQPDCAVAWNTVAALGAVESGHGTFGGAQLGADGRPSPEIRGPALDGGDFAAIRDTDGGSLDGDTTWDRAVGPLQFIPSTWADWAADGNRDGTADPDQIDDAALAAGRYLCHSGELDTPEAWQRAVFSFNHSDAYVADIAGLANSYAVAAG